MKITRSIVIAVSLLLGCSVYPAQAQQLAANESSLRVALVHADPAAPVRPHDLLRAVAFVTADAMPGAFATTQLHAGGQHVTVSEGKGGAFVVALSQRHRNDRSTGIEWLTKLDDAERQRIVDGLKKLVQDRAEMTPEARREAVEKLRKQRESIQAKRSVLAKLVQGQAEARKDGLNDRLARLDAERERLEIDLIAAQAREDAIRRQMDQLQRVAEEKAHLDPIQEQLRRVLALRKEELKRTRDMAAQGLAPTSEVMEVEGKVVEAEVQLLTRREQAMQPGDEHGDLLGRLAAELAMLSIDKAEKEARLSYINERLPRMNPHALDEKALDAIVQQHPSLLNEPGQLPPLYFELEKREGELLKEELALLVSEVRVESEATTAPTR